MTDQELEQRLRSWYRAEVPADLAAPADLRSRVVTIPRPSTHSWRGSSRRRGFTLFAAAALTGVIIGTALVGGVLNPQPDLSLVPPSQATPTDASPVIQSVAPSTVPGSSGLIAYVKFVPLEAVGGDCERGSTSWVAGQRPTGCSRIWVSDADGTDAHELLPDRPGYQTPIAWSPDGTRLLYEDATGLWLTDSSGTVLQSLPFEPLCGLVSPCYSYTYSPDGTKLAFVRPVERDPRANESVIAIADLGTGEVTELGSTFAAIVEDPGLPCGGGCDSGNNYDTQWSPDGTRLIFSRQAIGAGGDTLLMVDVDGTDLHEFVAMDLHAMGPRWSPDGSAIAFVSNLARDAGGDIYKVRPDGTGLRRLTTDTVSTRPEWTRAGRLVFTRRVSDSSAGPVFELWIMDADGANKAKLPVEDVAQLTAAGCLVCAWVRDPDSDIPATEFMINALWRPTP
jgi:Tol biopolymer transport system component